MPSLQHARIDQFCLLFSGEMTFSHVFCKTMHLIRPFRAAL